MKLWRWAKCTSIVYTLGAYGDITIHANGLNVPTMLLGHGIKRRKEKSMKPRKNWKTITMETLKNWTNNPSSYPKSTYGWCITDKGVWAVAPYHTTPFIYTQVDTLELAYKWLENMERIQPQPWLSFTSQKQWEEYLKSLLQRNDKALIKALTLIYQNQTFEEQNTGTLKEENGKGFTRIDSEFLTALAIKVKHNLELSPREWAILRNKMPKYWRQLMIISKENLQKPIDKV